MLELKQIHKIYKIGNEKSKIYQKVTALKDINLNFRESEFVSILGPSGCGKTTMLNIIGGLDKYTSGDLVINGRSTKDYIDEEWDTYRNHRIGFVFQSYNLIPHQSILSNVELALSIGGIPRAERHVRAVEALEKVGLGDQINKKPNQLSGGQMQRVAIARALVNGPDIILADEPTGALDTKTSEQVLDLLKEISKEKLIIMVTHNGELASKYSTRIIKLLDGSLIDDSNPYYGDTSDIFTAEKPLLKEGDTGKEEGESTEVFSGTNEGIVLSPPSSPKKKKSAMSFLNALRLSVSNLLSKKKRTFITSLAGSIGIIGISCILAVSAGMSDYVGGIEAQTTGMNYLTILSNHIDISGLQMGMDNVGGKKADIGLAPYPGQSETGIYPYDSEAEQTSFIPIKQNLSEEYIAYLEEKLAEYVIDISYTHNVNMNLISQIDDRYSIVSTGQSNWQELLDNKENVSSNYTTLKGEWPSAHDEVALVVDKYNRLSIKALNALGIPFDEEFSKISYDSLLDKTFKLVLNNEFYTENDGLFKAASTQSELREIYDSEKTHTIKITAIIRANENAANEWVSPGVAYTKALTQFVLANSLDSDVAKAQTLSKRTDVTTGKNFNIGGGINGTEYERKLQSLGAVATPSSITIYPKDYDSKDTIIGILDAWNEVQPEEKQVQYMDISNILISMLNSIIGVITYVLVAFSSISLVVSSIMIAIIIYASVIERTKEIGVLRSIGARKKDISRVFQAEAIIIGLVSGTIAILVTLLISVGINAILGSLVGVTTIAKLKPTTAVIMIGVNVLLTLLASLVPARLAAQKDPVNALRSD